MQIIFTEHILLLMNKNFTQSAADTKLLFRKLLFLLPIEELPTEKLNYILREKWRFCCKGIPDMVESFQRSKLKPLRWLPL